MSDTMRIGTQPNVGVDTEDHQDVRLQPKPDRRVVSMRDPLCPARRREDRLELMVARTDVRAGRGMRRAFKR